MPLSLVTGGAGFIGSHVAVELLRRGHTVVVLDDLSGGTLDNVPPKAHFEAGSILDGAQIEDLFRQYAFDYVFHLAAYAAEGLSHFIKRFNYNNNLIGSINLINASVNYGVKCFVFTSSIAVYGNAPLPMTEDTAPMPTDSYGIAKYAMERELEASREIFGLDYVIFRPHNVYGENQNIGDRYRNVIGIFMNQLMQGCPLTVFGDGEQTRAFSYIADVAPIIARSIEIPAARNQVFNIGANTPYTINHLARAVMQAMGIQTEIRHLPPRNEVVHAYSDHAKIRRVFGEQTFVSLEDGIAHMAAWAKRVGARKSKPFGKIEITKKSPAQLAGITERRSGMWANKTISVVFPVYNEEEGLLQAINDFFGTGWVDEIVVVDNNSTDRSAKLARSTRARVVPESRQGYGFALRRGLQEARGDWIILAEPDSTFMGKDILKLMAYADDFEMVMGTRTTRELIWAEANMGIFLRMGNLAVAKLIEFLFNGPSLSDCGCTLRLIHADAARRIQPYLTVGKSHFLPEMVILCLLGKIRIIEVPINYRGRLGTSKITGAFRTAWRVGWRMIFLILSYRLRAWLGRVPHILREDALAKHHA